MCLLLAGHKHELITMVLKKPKTMLILGKAREIALMNQLKLEGEVMVVISAIFCFGFLELFWERNGWEISKILQCSRKHMVFREKFRTAAYEGTYSLNYVYSSLSILAVKNRPWTFSHRNPVVPWDAVPPWVGAMTPGHPAREEGWRGSWAERGYKVPERGRHGTKQKGLRITWQSPLLLQISVVSPMAR